MLWIDWMLGWYGIGVATIVITLWLEAYRLGRKDMRIRRSFNELFEILVSKANTHSTVLLSVTALLGPLLPVAFAYIIARNWYDNLPVDKADKKNFPWTKN